MVFVIFTDEDVLDTWFSSALFPFSVFGWPHQVSMDIYNETKQKLEILVIYHDENIHSFSFICRVILVNSRHNH